MTTPLVRTCSTLFRRLKARWNVSVIGGVDFDWFWHDVVQFQRADKIVHHVPTITATVKEEETLLLLFKCCVRPVSAFPFGATKRQPVIARSHFCSFITFSWYLDVKSPASNAYKHIHSKNMEINLYLEAPFSYSLLHCFCNH